MARIRPQRFVHVVYRRRRFEQMLAWYQTVVDAKVRHRSPALAFLSDDDEHHRFAFANLAVLQPDGTGSDRRGANGVDHAAYTYASLGDLLDDDVQLEARGIVPWWCSRCQRGRAAAAHRAPARVAVARAGGASRWAHDGALRATAVPTSEAMVVIGE